MESASSLLDSTREFCVIAKAFATAVEMRLLVSSIEKVFAILMSLEADECNAGLK